MKLLLDQHLSRALIPRLEPAFPGTSHVLLHGLENADDDAVWRFAKAGGYAIATKDEDFNLLSFARGHPPKVIWLRSGDGPSSEVLDVLLRARQVIEQFDRDADQSLLMLP